jgi:hypothetical protein
MEGKGEMAAGPVVWGRLGLLALAAMVLAALAAACAGHGGRDLHKLEVTLGKTTPTELVRILGPPLERGTGGSDRPYERLHFNVPYDRNVFVEVVDPDGKDSNKIIRGKNVISFYFVGGLLSAVE